MQQVQATPTSNTVRREDASSSNSESHEPMPMDISPNVSPVKGTVTVKQEVSDIVPMATSGFTEPPADIKRFLLSSATPERPQASHTMKTLKVMKFQCPDPLNAQSSVFSLLEKCISCTKKILAVAKGEGKNTVTEPCTCKHRSAPSEILQNNSQSRGMTKKALEKSLGRPIAASKGANIERTFQTDSRTTRDFKQRCRSRWEPATPCNLGHVPLSDRLPATRSAMEPEHRKPISVSSHLQQQAAYSGSKCPANSELPQSSWKVAVSKSAKIATGSVPTVPHRAISPESETVVQAASQKSGAESCTVDACVGEKVKGVYTPDATIDTSQTTCVNIKVDTKLGGCVEMRDGPVEFPSEVEEQDEGWVLSFD